ncbi:MAG: hypothetical protein ACLPSW_33925 [Roseiarcus sp.]
MNLQNWVEQAREHWKRFLPSRYREFEEAGVLDEALQEAAKLTYREVSSLENAGLSSEQAWEMTKSWPIRLTACICALICAALVSDFTLNHFYKTGAYFWDSGTFAYEATFSTSWPMLGPPIEHRPPSGERSTFFQIHVMPIFFLTSTLHQAIPFISAAAHFSFLQGLWSGLLSLAVFIACARSDKLALTAITAVATAFCGPVLAAILKHPLIFYPTARTAAVAEFSMIKARKRSMSASKLGSGMLGMAS